MSAADSYASDIGRLLKSWQTPRQPESSLLNLLEKQTMALAKAADVPDPVRQKLLGATLDQLKELDRLRLHASPFSYVEKHIFRRVLSDLRKHIKSSAARGQVPLF
jgi:hypothetical protein